MSDARKKPSYAAARRIRWLAAGVVGVVVAYTGGWYWVAGQVDRAARTFAATGGDIVWSCPGQDVRGYPFRIGVFCDALDVATADGALSVTGGAVRSAAQVYDPRRVLAEFDSPMVLTDRGTGQTYRLSWSNARANVVTAPVAERMIAIEAEQVTLSINGPADALAVGEIGLYAREQDGGLDLAARPRDVVIDTSLTGGRDLPPFGLDIDIQLTDWESEWTGPVPGGEGLLRRMAVLLTNDRGAIVDGPFSVSSDGLVSGEFSVRIVDVPGVLAAMREVYAEYAPQIEALAVAQPRQEGQPEDELTLTLTVRDGRIFAGIIPLGSIPPLPVGNLSGLAL